MILDVFVSLLQNAFCVWFFFWVSRKMVFIEKGSEREKSESNSSPRTDAAWDSLVYMYGFLILFAVWGGYYPNEISSYTVSCASYGVWAIMGLTAAGNYVLKLHADRFNAKRQITEDVVFAFLFGLIFGPLLHIIGLLAGTWDDHKGISNPFYKEGDNE
jgi:hypothetical protein